MFAGSSDAQFMALLSGMTQDGVLPVSALAQRFNLRLAVASLVTEIVFLKLSPLGGIHQVEFAVDAARSNAIGIADVCSLVVLLTLLGGNDNNTVGAT